MINNLVRIKYCVVLKKSYYQWLNCHYRLSDALYARKTDLRLPAGFWLSNRTDLDFSFSPLLCRIFLVTSLGALLSVSSQLPLFPLCGELDCWLGHKRNRVWGCWCYCWLLQMVFVKVADHLPEIHNCWGQFLGVLFFRITFPCNQII